MVPYDAILFDFDGVLADSEALHYACWVEILTPHGIDLTWDNYRANCIGITDRAMLEVLRHQVDPPYDIDLLWPEYPRKKTLFRQKAAEKPPIAESTKELILSMAGQPIAVVSSSGRAELSPVLESAGLLACFKTLVCFEDVTLLKPHPEPYLEGARRLGARNPLVIEDSDAGVASGQAAGFDVLRLDHPDQLAEKLRSHLRGPRIG
ncbi:MAG: HAD family phosphatase [Acidobacteria bacterium]|nr:HAD family phosphatase [Acidobacteriota bacterium]